MIDDIDALFSDSALDQPIRFSTFKAADRPTPTERVMSLRQIAQMVHETNVSQERAKTTDHPLLKLAVFSGPRNADNIREVTGVEIDHDAGEIGPDEAIEAMRAAGIAALIYSTRKDSPEQRRWRALLPFSAPLPPARRRAMAEAALSALGVDNDDAGVSTAEGTAFYYAGVIGKPRFVEACEGRFIDQVFPDAGLDDEWGDWDAPGEDPDAHARLADFEHAVETGKLQSALDGIPLETMGAGNTRPTVIEVGFALHRASGGSDAGLDIWRTFANRSQWYTQQIESGRSEAAIARRQTRVWRRMRQERRKVISLGTVYHLAEQHGWSRSRLALADLEDLEDLAPIDSGTAVATVDSLDAMFDDDWDALSAPVAADPSINPDKDWRRLLHVTDEGEVKSTLHNIQVIVENDDRLFGRIGFNILRDCIVFIREPGRLRKKARDGKPIVGLTGPLWMLDNRGERVSGKRWIDAHTHSLRAMLEAPKTQGGYGLKVSDRDLNAALENIGHQNAFHPVRDFLRSVKWDGTPRLDTLFVDYLGADDTPYHRAAGRLFCLGAVTRAFEPGHKFDFVPILEGVQGKRKSTWISILGKSWFGELSCDWRDNKSVVEAMQGGWIFEIPELQGFSKADTTTLKAIISRTVDSARMSYARLTREFPRQCVFCGTTNEDNYLRDPTGSRRLWPIHCHAVEIDTDRFEREVDQIWAEAVVAYDALRTSQPHGTLPLYMREDDVATEAKRVQESRRDDTPEDVLAGEIRAALDEPLSTDIDGVEEPRSQTCVKEVWVDLLQRDPKALESHITLRLVGKALRMAGWVPGAAVRHPKYGVQKVFKRA